MRSRTAPLRPGLCMLMVGLVLAGASVLRSSGAASLPVAPPAMPAADAAMDGGSLAQALADAGVDLPDGSSVYAAVVVETGDGLAYEQFQAGEGALFEDFWPASSVKLLAAEGALAYLAELGFTGAATITMDGERFTVEDVYQEAIADSSNEAYDTLVRIAGVDWLNTRFLTADNGFPTTVIQRSYTGDGVRISPAMTVSENGRRVTVAARTSTETYDCPDDGNCSNLLEMTESVRRVVLDEEVVAEDRLPLAETDVAGLQHALLEAEGFVEPAVVEVLAEGAKVYNKPGYVPGDACVDVAVVSDPATAQWFLLGIATPEDGWTCPALVEVATATLEFLKSVE